MAELKEFKLPDVGEGLTEADIVAWHVKPGEAVEDGQIIVEIETAKAVVELPCPWDGTVARLLAEEGQTVDVGVPIIAVEVAGQGTVDSAERACVSASAARCTSSRVIEPSGPLPASAARLMPRSLASLRTGGFASARAAAATPGSAARGSGARGSVARGSVGSSGASTGTSGAVGTSAVSGRPAAVLRARRVVEEVLTP